MPALVFAVCTIPALYHLGRQITSRQEALLASVFLVGSYHHVWFSQNARGYTGLILGAVLASILFLRLIKSANPQILVIPAYAIVVALTTWIHPDSPDSHIDVDCTWADLADADASKITP